jgi:hypothetical protein
MMRLVSAMLVTTITVQVWPLGAAEINPDDMPNPLNKIFFGVRTHPENGPPRSMQIEVDTVKECIDHVKQALAKKVGDTDKANEVRCIKERNAEKPS